MRLLSVRLGTFGVIAPLIAILLAGQPARATTGTWNIDASGNWSDSTRWLSGTIPGTAASDIANLTFNITGTRTVTIDTTSRIIGAMTIGDITTTSNSFTLAASGGATL